MRLNFSKMHGLGNDFMVIDGINQSFYPNKDQLKQWSDRHFGVGFDQLLLVESPESAQAEFKYRIFNADGTEVEQCGNGARCFARFVTENGLTQSQIIPVETANGMIYLKMLNEVDVEVDMGKPIFEVEKIPLSLKQDSQYQLTFEGETLTFSSLSMGNPHAVIEVEDVDNAPVEKIGAFIESHEYFPNHVNVGFMQIVNRQEIKVRVFERGVGETQACGTGACAAMVAARKLNKIDQLCKVKLLGGDLSIQWLDDDSSVMMTGSTALVYEGKIDL